MVSYLQIENLTKSFGDRILFENISLGIGEGDRVGLIAKNGAGKTTLLNILADKEDYDSGRITYRNGLRVGYLEQSPFLPARAFGYRSVLPIRQRYGSSHCRV